MENRTIQENLKKLLQKKRYEHTIGVMYTAASLAMCYGTDTEQALKAGLLHDCGKYGSGGEQLKRCHELKIELTEAEKKMPALVHAKLGAYYARNLYEVTDVEILNAIRYHTTGRPGMTMLEKIIYIADYIEPGRPLISGLAEVRRIAFRNIDRAVFMASGNTLNYLKNSEKCIDPVTVDTYEFYKYQNI